MTSADSIQATRPASVERVSSSLRALMVKTTSSAVNWLPSCQRTSWRTEMVISRRSSDSSELSARRGVVARSLLSVYSAPNTSSLRRASLIEVAKTGFTMAGA